jgi:hypothetical protein
MRFDVKNLIEKRIDYIVCKIFVSNMASNPIYLCKFNVTIAERTVAPHKNSDITSEFCIFTKIYTNILRAKQNKSTVIEIFHRKIDIVAEYDAV